MSGNDAIPTLGADDAPSDGVTKGPQTTRPGAKQRARATALGVMLWVFGVPTGASAMAPPVEFALEAVGAEADERADASWAMTKVDDGIVELCGKSVAEDGEGTSRWRFTGDDVDVTMGPEAEAPWNLLWTILWSSKPGEALLAHGSDWSDATGRIEVFDGAPVYCYGDASRLCVDEALRRIVAVDVEVEERRWGVRVTGEGKRVQLSEEGSLVGRLRTGEECAP